MSYFELLWQGQGQGIAKPGEGNYSLKNFTSVLLSKTEPATIKISVDDDLVDLIYVMLT